LKETAKETGMLMNKEMKGDYKIERREKALKETDVLVATFGVARKCVWLSSGCKSVPRQRLNDPDLPLFS
jgi:hypothetical protein